MPEEEKEGEERNNINDRFTKLSQKIEEEAKGRQAAEAKAQQEAEEKAKIAKERDFFKGFNAVSSKYPGVTEYQDKILEKVNAGYDLEDAAVAILAKEGKYTPPKVVQEVVAGGSAANNPNMGASKGVQELTRDEKRAKLKELIG